MSCETFGDERVEGGRGCDINLGAVGWGVGGRRVGRRGSWRGRAGRWIRGWAGRLGCMRLARRWPSGGRGLED